MNLADLKQIQERILRIVGRLQEKIGSGFSQSHTFPNGEVHRYHVTGIKSLDSFEDELLTAYIWVWSMKDYLKAVAQTNGQSPEGIENIVDSTFELQLVSDIANKAKHGKLKKSRSSHFASLSNVALTIPQQAMSRITVGAFDVTTDVSTPNKVEFTADVVSDSGVIVGDANQVLNAALEAWEKKGVKHALGA